MANGSTPFVSMKCADADDKTNYFSILFSFCDQNISGSSSFQNYFSSNKNKKMQFISKKEERSKLGSQSQFFISTDNAEKLVQKSSN